MRNPYQAAVYLLTELPPFRYNDKISYNSVKVGTNMSRTCDVCGKSLMYGHKVSNSYNHTKRTWRPNLHKVKAIVDGTTRTINVCANCIRSDYVEKKVRIPKDVRTALAEQDKKAAEAQ